MEATHALHRQLLVVAGVLVPSAYQDIKEPVDDIGQSAGAPREDAT
jgi:hypothetical protein